MILRYNTKQLLASPHICSRASSSSSLPSKRPPSDKQGGSEVGPSSTFQQVKSRIKSVILGTSGKQTGAPGGRNQTPINWNYPNQRFIDDWQPEASLEEIYHEAGPFLRDQKKKMREEFKQRASIDKPWMDSVLPRHNQADIEYHFRDDQQLKRWETGCDADWGEGYSKCKLERTSNNTVVFSGYLDTRVVRDGRIERAGWTSMKTQELAAFNRKRYLHRWSFYNHVIVKCRGDGRSYKLILYTPGYIDVTWGDCWSYPLHTHGGPYWQYARLPFSRFFHTVGGRIQDKQHHIYPFDISNIGIVLMDRQDGPFRLEVEFIGALQDSTHTEKFAYEAYSLPLFSTDTL